MKDSNLSSNKPLPNSNPTPSTAFQDRPSFGKFFAILFLIFAIVGFGDATYLTIQHFTGGALNCGVHGGCEIVTSSEYATFFGIPVALFGAFYYLTILLLSVFYLDKKREKVLQFVARLTPLGFLASVYFVYLQLFVIHSICYYCMGSAVSSTLLFVVGMVYLYRINKQKI